MGFTPLMVRTVSSIPAGESVCEFGNQRFGWLEYDKSPKGFYEELGYTDYVALDVNEERDGIIADLNYPVDLGRTFHLVTNNGTSEHIFNQAMVFENAHNLSHRFMIHSLPFSPWFNHGFYNYNPILFRDLARSNDYKYQVIVASRWGDMADVEFDELFNEKKKKALLRACDEIIRKRPYSDLLVTAIFEKKTDAPFKYPIQGKYYHDIDDEELRSRYA